MQAEPRVFLPIPTGAYPAKIKEVEQVDGQYGPQWRWTFDLGLVENVEEEMEEKTLTYYTPNYITGANKLGKMLSALGIPTDEIFESSDIIGKGVTLTVIEAPRKDGSIGNNIEAVLPPRKKKAGANGAAAPAKVVEAAVDEDGPEPDSEADEIPW